MSQLTRDRLLAALGVPRASREELGELSYEGHADLLGCKTRLTAVAEQGGVLARCEMQLAAGQPWTLAWSWAIQSSADGRMRLARSDYPGATGDAKAPGSIEEAKAIARAAILQIRQNPQWTKSGLACGPNVELPRFAELAVSRSPNPAPRSAATLPASAPSPRAAVPAFAQPGLFAEEPATLQSAFKR